MEDLHRWIRGSLSRMDPGLRALLVMKILEGRSYRDIAESSGLSVTQVGRLTHRALKDLSSALRRFANPAAAAPETARRAPSEGSLEAPSSS